MGQNQGYILKVKEEEKDTNERKQKIKHNQARTKKREKIEKREYVQ